MPSGDDDLVVIWRDPTDPSIMITSRRIEPVSISLKTPFVIKIKESPFTFQLYVNDLVEELSISKEELLRLHAELTEILSNYP